jgi:hypothetical protein
MKQNFNCPSTAQTNKQTKQTVVYSLLILCAFLATCVTYESPNYGGHKRESWTSYHNKLHLPTMFLLTAQTRITTAKAT